MMKTVCSKNECNGCMACISICPKKCIDVKDDICAMNATIDESSCVNCNLCKKICPNLSTPEKKQPIEWKQGWAKDEIRKHSTSGGVASSIIYSFIASGGYVASCLFRDGDFIFDITNDFNVAKKFAGSKYVKSNPSDIYEKIKNRLITDRVLFVGLPCQVSALVNYVKNDKNLYTIDLICHGTPSKKLLDMYLEERGYDICTAEEVKFRTKTDMGLCINGRKIDRLKVTDHYLCSFLQSINYTDNCYVCRFASLERVSDITLGDSWGTELKEQEKEGVSLVLIQTEKGKELIDSAQLVLSEVDLENAVLNNKQLLHPSIKSKKRTKFMNLISKGHSFKYSTFSTLPVMVLKQKLKLILIKLHIL